jgi:hypothetical protein
MSDFPTSLPTTSTIPVEASGTSLSTNHVASHQGAQNEIIAIATKVGVDGSAVTTTHDYKLSAVTGSNKAVPNNGATIATPTITGATITTSTVNGVTLQTAGSATDFLAANGTYQTGSVANASTTVKGISELATSAEITAGTATGGTGAALVVTPDALAASTPVFNGSGLTNILFCKNGSTTRDMSTTTTTTIAHGLGRAPQLVKLHVNRATSFTSGASASVNSVGSYDGSTQNCNYVGFDTNGSALGSGQDTSYAVHYDYGTGGGTGGNTLQGSVSVDATNITITWTKTNSPTGTGDIHWEAIAH